MSPILRRITLLPLATGIFLSALVRAEAEGENAPVKPRAPYPLQICIVSGEHLNPGETVDYVHKEPGKPDRLIRLCCRKCVARFKADPVRFLKKLDQPVTPPVVKAP